MRRLLLSNWPSWHPAASATQWAEFESKKQSSTSPGESRARLPAGLRPHRHPWCHPRSTWSAQERTEGIYRRRGKMAYRKRYVYAIIYKPQSSKNLALVGGRPYYHLDGANAKYIINLENLSMISITKVVISNEILNSPNCGVEGSHSPNEQDLRHNEDGFRAKYSRKITADFLWGKGQLSLHLTFPEKDAQTSPYARSYPQNCIKIEKISNHFQGFNDKPVGRQISKTNWWCVFHLWDSRKPKGSECIF